MMGFAIHAVALIATILAVLRVIVWFGEKFEVNAKSLKRLAKKHGLYVEVFSSQKSSGYNGMEPKIRYVKFYSLELNIESLDYEYEKKNRIVIDADARDFKLRDYKRILDAYENKFEASSEDSGVKFFD